jgi:hypothetical protein
LVPSFDRDDNFVWIGGPCKGFGVVVMLGEEAVDGGLEVDNRVEDAALQTALGEPGEETLHGIQP